MSHRHSTNIEINNKLHIYYISFDLLDNGYGQVKDKFYNELFDDIPAFAFGTDVMNQKKDEIGLVPTVREAMKKYILLKKFRKLVENIWILNLQKINISKEVNLVSYCYTIFYTSILEQMH